MRRLLILVLVLASPALAEEPVSKEILDLSLVPPVINTSPGPEYSDAQRDYAMTIGIERTPKGRLWAAWVGGGDSDLGYFVLATSDDDGRTWSQPRVVIDPPEAPNGLRRRILVGNLWTDPRGRLWLFFDQSMGYYDGRAGDWYIRCDDPDAAAPKWTAPTRFADGVTLNKPTVLKNGDWLLPVSLWNRTKIGPKAMLAEAYPELDDKRMANVYASSDQGATWTRRGGVVFPEHDFDEHMTVERRDGSLWMLARTKAGIFESTSTDGGRTWSEPKFALPCINARFFLRRLASGKLLLVKHGPIDERTKSRSHLTAFLSDDDGRTWAGGLILDERNGVSYPDGFQAPDGSIYVSYDRNRAADREILFAKFTEADIAAGKLVSEGSRLQSMISKALGPKKK